MMRVDYQMKQKGICGIIKLNHPTGTCVVPLYEDNIFVSMRHGPRDQGKVENGVRRY